MQGKSSTTCTCTSLAAGFSTNLAPHSAHRNLIIKISGKRNGKGLNS
jgi:hypothetical protein